MKLPQLGLWSTLRYLRDPAGLLRRGRALGPMWRFRHPRHGRITVFSAHGHAMPIIAARLQPADAALLTPWLGPSSAWTTRDDNAGQAVVASHRIITGILHEDARPWAKNAMWGAANGGDIGPALRSAALMWLVHGTCGEDLRATIAARHAAEDWARAARTWPLLVPALRCFCPDVGAARLELVARLADCIHGHALDSLYGAWLCGAMMTVLGPIADALPMIAMQALAHQDHRPAQRIAAALRQPPIPLVLLRAMAPVELQEHIIGAGEVVGLDLAGCGLPFGPGTLAWHARAVAEVFATAVTDAASRYDLGPSGPPRIGRVRLCVGPISLRMAPRG